MKDPLPEAIESMRSHAFVVVEGLVAEPVLRGLCDDIQNETEARFRPAGVGRGQQFVVAPTVRADRVLWMDPDALTAAQTALFLRLGEVQQALNRAFFLGLRHFEGHLTVYPRGAHYERHVDQFANQGHRLVSWVLYLNRTWDPLWGGQLRLYPTADRNDAFVDVEPTWGRVVLFWSDAVPHEVLRTHAPRLSATGWFRDDDG